MQLENNVVLTLELEVYFRSEIFNPQLPMFKNIFNEMAKQPYTKGAVPAVEATVSSLLASVCLFLRKVLRAQSHAN